MDKKLLVGTIFGGIVLLGGGIYKTMTAIEENASSAEWANSSVLFAANQIKRKELYKSTILLDYVESEDTDIKYQLRELVKKFVSNTVAKDVDIEIINNEITPLMLEMIAQSVFFHANCYDDTTQGAIARDFFTNEKVVYGFKLSEGAWRFNKTVPIEMSKGTAKWYADNAGGFRKLAYKFVQPTVRDTGIDALRDAFTVIGSISRMSGILPPEPDCTGAACTNNGVGGVDPNSGTLTLQEAAVIAATS